MATIVQCFFLTVQPSNHNSKFLSLKGISFRHHPLPYPLVVVHQPTLCSSSLSFSQSVSQCVNFSSGNLWIQKPMRQLIVCEATAPTKKSDSAAKRAHQAEKRRVYNKSKKSEARTRMKKVLEALEGLTKEESRCTNLMR